MATVAEILAELRKLGSEAVKRVLVKHGAREPFYGVKIEELKKIQKWVKHDHELALELYASGISDAMYLAALVSEPQKMTKAQLDQWAKGATWSMISEYALAWTAAESRFAVELGRKWIDSKKELIASCGWNTLSSHLAMTPDEELDLAGIQELLARVLRDVEKAPNRVKYTMNGFVISVGTHFAPLLADAKATAQKLGKFEVGVGETECKIPLATESIQKVELMNRVGKKRKTAFC